MAKKFQLDISSACHERWSSMTPSEQGRFCASCQKTVVDFSRMSDAQLAQFFRKPPENVCGRFFADQLGRPIETPRKRIPWIKYFFQITLPALLFSFKPSAQKMPAPISTEVAPWQVEKKDTEKVQAQQTFITGTLHTEDGSPMVNGTVMVKGGRTGTTSNRYGQFRLEVQFISDSLTLVCSAVGYKEKEITVTRGKGDVKGEISSIDLGTIAFEETEIMILGFVGSRVVRKPDSSFVLPPIEKPSPAMFSIYPNPVEAGASINITCERLEKDYYTIRLYNLSGQRVMEKQTWIDGEDQVLDVGIPRLPAGIYLIELVSRSGRVRFSGKVEIVESLRC